MLAVSVDVGLFVVFCVSEIYVCMCLHQGLRRSELLLYMAWS